jgi:probable F420-dependent oxidoreductase
MREMVLAIRAIWDRWQNGTRLDFRGEFYNHTLMTPVFDPGPNPHGVPRIFCAGVGPRMTEVVGEVADGFFVHPFHTPESVRQVTLPALERGLAKAGRERSSFEISCQVILVTGRDEEQFAAARNGARAQISFYGSTPAYRPVLECHGLGDLQAELNRLSKQGKWLEMAGLIDDDVLEKIAVVAPRNEVAAKLRERCGGWADRVSLLAHFAGPDLLEDVVEDLSRASA